MRGIILVTGLAAMGAVAVSLAGAPEPAAKTGVAVTAQADFPLAAKRARSTGEAVFLAKCQYCHVEMGPGTISLAKRLGPDHALLATRTDLTADYVKAVVRHGLNTMPAINRVEVSDAELERIAAYLSRSEPDTRKK